MTIRTNESAESQRWFGRFYLTAGVLAQGGQTLYNPHLIFFLRNNNMADFVAELDGMQNTVEILRGRL